jgi:peptide/nickel transport system permease protein
MSATAAVRALSRSSLILLALVVVPIAAAPFVAPNPPEQRFDDLLYAPPTTIHVWNRGPVVPFVYPQRVVSRIERRFEEDRTHPEALSWFTRGRLVTTAHAPLLLLGADSYGRDLFSRLLFGGRISLALAVLSALGAVAFGALLGGIAGYAGGWIDGLISRSSEFLLVLPTMYVVLVLRAVLPLALAPAIVFVLLTVIFAALGWPIVARGTRAIVLGERQRDYVEAARAAGASPVRLLLRHLLPAASGYLATQTTLLVPAFILAEATLSYVGFGFPPAMATWGTMLHDTANVLLVADVPWLLAPAVAIFLTVLAVNLLVQASGRPPVQLEG